LADQMSLEKFSEVLLAAASSLTRLSLGGRVVSFLEQDQFFDINLPALISLDIHWPGDVDSDVHHSDGYISNLWESLEMPALETLFLYRLSSEEFHECLEGLKRQRHAGTKVALKSLFLEEIVLEDYAGDLVSACPNLVEFSLIGTAAEPVMELILGNTKNTNSFDIEPLWPRLRCFTVTSRNNSLLRAVVLARKAAGYPFAELCLSELLSTDEIAWFRQQVEVVSIR